MNPRDEALGAESSDAALLGRTRAGDAESLTILYRRYREQVYSMAFRITASSDEAMDVVQDVFVGLPEALRSYDGNGPLGAWLRRIATRTALAHQRGDRRRLRRHQRAAEDRGENDPALAVEARLTLERALARMPQELRTVFVLKEMEGYTHGDIAAMLGITQNASQVRLHRARRFLKQRLMDRL